MKYKERVGTKLEAVANILETLQRGIVSNATPKTEALAMINKLKSIIKDIDNLVELED